jgi:serine/threonine-protein kinase RsbT
LTEQGSQERQVSPDGEQPLRLLVTTQLDAHRVRRAARALAQRLGFTAVDAEAVALAVTELATNLARYATGGEIVLSPLGGTAPVVESTGRPEAAAAREAAGLPGEARQSDVLQPRRTGIEVVSQDAGPGIADIARALEDGYSTGGGLGDGLPAVRRLMDEFDIRSGPEGTRIVTRKWVIRGRS